VETKSYSEDEVNNREAKMRRSYERRMREMQAEFDKKIAGLEAKISTTPPPPPPSADSDSQDSGKIELLTRRWEQREKELQAQIDAQNTAMEQERKRRLELQRSRMLDDALLKAGVSEKNMKIARRYFGPDVVWDELDETFMFKTPSGNMVSIDDGVQEFLPDNLKPSKILRGGAGTHGGMPSSNATRSQRALDEAKAKLAEYKAAATKNPNNALMSQFSKQKQIVARMERELRNATK